MPHITLDKLEIEIDPATPIPDDTSRIDLPCRVIADFTMVSNPDSASSQTVSIRVTGERSTTNEIQSVIKRALQDCHWYLNRIQAAESP